LLPWGCDGRHQWLCATGLGSDPVTRALRFFGIRGDHHQEQASAMIAAEKSQPEARHLRALGREHFRCLGRRCFAMGARRCALTPGCS